MKLGWLAPLLLLLALSIWAAYEITSGDDSESGPNDAPASLLIGSMQSFELRPDRPSAPLDLPLIGAEGETSLAAYKGRLVLLNFWAEWCAPCREEMPTLAALEAALGGEDFQVLPISLDRAPIGQAAEKLAEFGGNGLTTLSDPTMSLMGELGILGLPTTVLLDREGREIGRLTGPADWNSREARALVKAHLGGE